MSRVQKKPQHPLLAAVKHYPIVSPAVRKEVVRHGHCPDCGAVLDIGFECNRCGFDAKPILEKLVIVANS